MFHRPMSLLLNDHVQTKCPNKQTKCLNKQTNKQTKNVQTKSSQCQLRKFCNSKI